MVGWSGGVRKRFGGAWVGVEGCGRGVGVRGLEWRDVDESAARESCLNKRERECESGGGRVSLNCLRCTFGPPWARVQPACAVSRREVSQLMALGTCRYVQPPLPLCSATKPPAIGDHNASSGAYARPSSP